MAQSLSPPGVRMMQVGVPLVTWGFRIGLVGLVFLIWPLLAASLAAFGIGAVLVIFSDHMKIGRWRI